MKKIFILTFMSILFAPKVFAQLDGCYAVKVKPITKPEKDIFHTSLGYTPHHVAITTMGNAVVTKKVIFFFGANIAPSTNEIQTEKESPYRAIYNSYVGGYIGIGVCLNKSFTVGLGGEFQETTKKFAVPGGYEQIVHYCARLYSKGNIGAKTNFLITCNMFGRLFDAWGYCARHITPKI